MLVCASCAAAQQGIADAMGFFLHQEPIAEREQEGGDV